MVAALLLGELGFHIWLLGARWINPDEGAHLMDALLVIRGFVPELDFDSRQPLYVYSYVPFFKLFGASLTVGRILPLVSTWLTALLLYMIGRRLWGVTYGVVAALCFMLAPIILISAPLVKTEPLTMLVTTAGMYWVLAFLQTGRSWQLVAAGAAFGAGFYIRESALAALLAATILTLAFSVSTVQIVRRELLLYGGAAMTCLVILFWYSAHGGWSVTLQMDALNPPLRVWRAVVDFIGIGAPAAPAAQEDWFSSVRGSPQEFRTTLGNISRAVKLSAPLVIAFMIAVIAAARRVLPLNQARRKLSSPELLGVSLSITWIMCLALLYGYYALKRGFYQSYFREFIPPMALLLSWVMHRSLQRLGYRQYALPSVGAGLLLCVGLFLFERASGGSGVLTGIVATGVLCAVLAAPQQGLRVLLYSGFVVGLALSAVLAGIGPAAGPIESTASWVLLMAVTGGVMGAACIVFPRIRDRGRLAAIAGLVLLAASSVGASSYGSARLGLDYESPWAPNVLDQVVSLIRSHSAPDDSVLSGGVIWEFEAGRRVVANLSHPIGVRDSQVSSLPAEFVEEMRADPPAIIILDGFTEQTYSPLMPELPLRLENEYRLLGTFPGPKETVQVFGRNVP